MWGGLRKVLWYDGPISREVSFGGLLKSGEAFAKRLLSAFNDQRNRPQIVHIATDGETFGHHHRFGEMALSYCLHYIKSSSNAKIINYGEYLEKHPPTHTVEIFEKSSWSCVHGVERWKDNCGCNSGKHPKWTQAWRKPLRLTMDAVRDKLASLYDSEASKYLNGPWDARDDYIEVILDRSRENVEDFLRKHAIKGLSKEKKAKTLKLLEVQRNAMLMYTSCGWFFDDVSGIETIQVMQYASKAIQYAEEFNRFSLEPAYLKNLEEAPCNIYENAAKVYEMFVKPARSDLLRAGAHYSISSIFEKCPEEDIKTFHYTVKSFLCGKMKAGKLTLTLGKAIITSGITWDEKTVIFAVLHLGDHNINGGVKEFGGDEDFLVMQDEIKKSFEKGDVPELIRIMDKRFGSNIYSVRHLFKDEQRKVLNHILQPRYEEIETSYRRIYENNSAIMNFLHGLQIPLPRHFFIAAEYLLNIDIKNFFFEKEDLDVEKLKKLISEIQKWSIKIDKTTIEFVASSWITSLVERLYQQPRDLQLFKKIENTLEILKPLSLSFDFWRSQNKYFSIGKNFYISMKEKAANGDSFAKRWLENFINLGNYLNIKV